MTRLQTQYQRLYQLNAIEGGIVDSSGPTASHGQVRSLVLSLSGPADWVALAPVWHSVQTDLDWPAPAIAVNGVDAFELWFSLVKPVALTEAAALLQALRMRYLADLKAERVRLWPTTNSTDGSMPRIPALLAPERWSAFVAPDLAGVFDDDNPSLDVEPSENAQAELLSRLRCIEPSGWRVAMARLLPAAPSEPAAATADPPLESVTQPGHGDRIGTHQDPRRFLLEVMNNPTVPLALRVDAAKALLSNTQEPVL